MTPEQVAALSDEEYEEYQQDREQWSARLGADGEILAPDGRPL